MIACDDGGRHEYSKKAPIKPSEVRINRVSYRVAWRACGPITFILRTQGVATLPLFWSSAQPSIPIDRRGCLYRRNGHRSYLCYVAAVRDRHQGNGVRISITGVSTVIAIVLALTMGCAQKKPEVWSPKPVVLWPHIAPTGMQGVEDGYRLMVDGKTKGLFPARMAVTRIALQPSEERVDLQETVLRADPRNEFLQWNRALDDLMAISEVFPIKKRDLGGGPAQPSQILAAAKALHARLGLVYSVNELSRQNAEMFGILYDTEAGVPLAALHARSSSIEEMDNDSQDTSTLWETDSRALVRVRFEKFFRACIRELILRDERPAVQEPKGWRPPRPTLPVEWPPRQVPTGGRS